MPHAPKIQWSDALSTGNRAIDVQHKYLIDIINDLAELIESGQSAKKIGAILNLLQYYTEWHFHREELCMDRYQCPIAPLNRSAHQQFIETFLAFRKDFSQNPAEPGLAERMYRTLTDWLVNHIQRVDGEIGPCMLQEAETVG